MDRTRGRVKDRIDKIEQNGKYFCIVIRDDDGTKGGDQQNRYLEAFRQVDNAKVLSVELPKEREVSKYANPVVITKDNRLISRFSNEEVHVFDLDRYEISPQVITKADKIVYKTDIMNGQFEGFRPGSPWVINDADQKLYFAECEPSSLIWRLDT